MVIDCIQHVMRPLERQIAALDEAGVDGAVLFSTAVHPEASGSFALASIEREMQALYRVLGGAHGPEERARQMEEAAAELSAARAARPDRFIAAFGPVPLGWGQRETERWVQEHVVDAGFEGIGEITPGTDGQVAQVEAIAAASDAAGGLPLWVHTFTPVTSEGLAELGRIARRHPRVPTILGHGGGYHWMQAIALVRELPNAWYDLSAQFSPLATRVALHETPEKCLFGTDAPYGEPQVSLDLIRRVSPNDDATHQVLGENLLGLLEKAKANVGRP